MDAVEDELLRGLGRDILRLAAAHTAAMARVNRVRCDAALAREMMAMEDSDPAADRADWEYHQRRET